ncbi:MutS-related protein [Pedobacter metabolipauper]|uniref:MutS-like protein n=1 Tax=Pedobacter metabolipauper TaxID=425513 RepID=A0A4V6PVZ8_9SPHI|nr:DNA mismatch repair protein MutS [Pedobacter metabolipauper]TDQ07559.1 MutS-like protein [Pedobacter metabolipauper]
MSKTKQQILEGYYDTVKSQQALIAELKSKLNLISFSRLGLFVAEILIIAAVINIGYHLVFVALAIVPVICFLILVKKQAAVQLELKYEGQLLWVYQNEINQTTEGKNGYANGENYSNESHPYTSDLDILGAGSLFSFINRCNTFNGLNILEDSLSLPKDKEKILSRQLAIKELTVHIDQTFHFRAQLQDHKPEELLVIKDKLEHQLPNQLKFTNKPPLKLYVKIVPFLTLLLFILGVVYGQYFWKIFGFIAVFNAGLTFFYLTAINKLYYGFTGSSNLLNAFSGTIKWTEDIKWESAYIKNFFTSNKEPEKVSIQIKQLSGIIQAFDARLNVILSSVLNLFLLWDLRCSVNLSKWHSKSSEHLVNGLYRISQFEELISFATLHYNEPGWVFPDISDAFQLKTTAIGHPLIKDSNRIVNDFSLSAQPTVDIVTGSNMAGKSTFLRTVGINMVLAFAGAPVCAKELSLSIFRVVSYMRIKDSLNDQTSTFKAELNRLKMILNAIDVQKESFVLIDEMLRGTNSKDKYLGSKVFIQKLIEQHTPALFATHDLQLSEMQDNYSNEVRNYHFDIQISDGEMNFDYKLKYGPCTTFNAALLLKEIGLTLN